MSPDGAGKPTRLTNNTERSGGLLVPPDGHRIVFACRRGGADFEDLGRCGTLTAPGRSN